MRKHVVGWLYKLNPYLKLASQEEYLFPLQI